MPSHPRDQPPKALSMGFQDFTSIIFLRGLLRAWRFGSSFELTIRKPYNNRNDQNNCAIFIPFSTHTSGIVESSNNSRADSRQYRDGSVVGINIQDFSRIVTQELVDDAAGLQRIKEYLVDLPAGIPFIWQNYVGGVARNVATDATAVHPAWRRAFAFIDVVDFGSWEGPTAAQNASFTALVANMTEVFGPAAYYNEAYHEEQWQNSFFGSNYGRLLKIKKSVDPKGVFSCRMCVGSEKGF
ncbi:hypothetical protein P171DRAFT_495595 [Karstenula rhodostoma CBS 690.94]|uniref:Berberine/berberine-like domain-containing protein n=1 Tax=Karstenula rhodostoma CBS 690.94 TaxID=1392251 RepID=A0A9P4PGJ6_9PLEO|nr:hypothetical protein P171DRAFT_495595 [Karstenula rhodostoma CBS 690.94]